MKSLLEVINEAKNTKLGSYDTMIQGAFKWKKNTNYRMRYNKFEKRFEVFAAETQRGMGKPEMFIIKCDDESKGVEIVRLLQDAYAKGGCTLSYENTSYGF